jgi:hypothetical protein
METVFLVQLPSISFELTIMFSNSQELGPQWESVSHPPTHRLNMEHSVSMFWKRCVPW